MTTWKIVPSEPSREMRIAMAEALTIPLTSANSKKIQRAYHAALQVAPQPEETT